MIMLYQIAWDKSRTFPCNLIISDMQ